MKNKYIIALALLFSLVLKAQIIAFPDTVFKTALLSGNHSFGQDNNLISIDLNENGEVEQSEALQVYKITVDGFLLNGSEINSIEGIEYFTNLLTFNARDNAITTADLTALSNLEYISLSNNLLNSLNVSGLNHLLRLGILNNQLTGLDLTGLMALTYINFNSNPITQIGLSSTPNLESLYFSQTSLESLDVSGLAALETVWGSQGVLSNITFGGNNSLDLIFLNNNELTSIDLSGCPALNELWLNNNFLTELDLSHQTEGLSNTNATNNQLVFISFKNGIADIGQATNFSQNPGLLYACCDEFEQYQLNQKLNTYGNSSTIRTMYCDTDPGAYFYRIEGANTFSFGGDCSTFGIGVPFQKYQATTSDGISTNYFSNGFGQYRIPFPAGFASVTPILESPAFFTVMPPNVETEFPQQISPLDQDFCLVPIADHTDVEVSLFPLEVARPGELSIYRIVYRNKGTVSTSGNIALTYDSGLSQFIVSQPAVMLADPSQLTWNFSGLQPFESREISFTLQHSVPPIVDQGDILQFSVHSTPTTVDEFPIDDTAQLNQPVLSSLDPNDKVCTEGTIVGIDVIGQFVHYIIRFENTGSYAAENVVVSDIINASKFDVSTLQPLSGSHPFVTRITGDKVEFVFNDINLPFQEPLNHGYVAFKIKTLPTLMVGDTFSNMANIYFDYNAAVVTDPAVTVIELLSIGTVDFADTFTLYPNPTDSSLNLRSLGAAVTSNEVYNMLGQLVLLNIGSGPIDVSMLKTGSYLLQIHSEKGVSTAHFSKK